MGSYRIHGGHGEPGAVREYSHVAFEFDEQEVLLLGLELERCADRAFWSGGRLAEHRVVVDHELAIKRDQFALVREGEWVDLEQLCVELAEQAVEREKHAGKRDMGAWIEVGRDSDIHGLSSAKTSADVDIDHLDLVG